jgi:hypothetical protein
MREALECLGILLVKPTENQRGLQKRTRTNLLWEHSGVQVILGVDDGTNPFQLNEHVEKL